VQEFVNQIDQLGRQGQFQKGVEAANQGLERHPGSWQLTAQRGACQQMLDHPAEAAEDFGAALKQAPAARKWGLHLGRAQCYAVLDQRPQAEKEFASALKTFDPAAEAWRRQQIHQQRGRNLLEDGRFKQAVPCFDSALKLDPKDHEALGMRALCYSQLKDKKRYQADLKALKELNPSTARAVEAQVKSGGSLSSTARYLNLGDQLAADDKVDLALEQYEKAIALEPRDSQAYLHKGVLLQSKGRFQEAIQAYTRSIELSPNGPALAGRADCYLATDEVARARADYEKMLTMRDPQAQLTARQALKDLPKGD
jgi:tetratricopeptide (TPR) repeat protein